MDYLDELQENQQGRVDRIEKSFDSTYIEKGKKAQIGEIRQWKDGKYQMTTNGWVYIKGTGPKLAKKAEEPEKKEETPKVEEKGSSLNLVDQMRDKVREEYNSAVISYNSALKRLKELNNKGVTLYSKEYSSKIILKDAYREKEKAEANLDRAKYGSTVVKKVMKELGLKGIERTGTAIRGFSTLSKGYEFSEWDKSSISFAGVDQEQFDTLVKRLEEAGIKVSSKSNPSKSIGAGMVSSIEIEPVYPEFKGKG